MLILLVSFLPQHSFRFSTYILLQKQIILIFQEKSLFHVKGYQKSKKVVVQR